VKPLANTPTDQIYGPNPDRDLERTSAHSSESPALNLNFLSPPQQAGSIGRLGHYEVLEVLGRGGFGIVLRATDEVLKRVVAIKVLAPEMATLSPARKRFLREAQAGAAVRHENVVQVYAIEAEPLPYIAMEYIPGETLQQRMEGTGPFPADAVVRIGIQIAKGLAAAHDTGLIHRDVKPANIILEKGIEERVKITDFGLARTADDASVTESGIVAGTPLYMSPEQAYGEPLDHRSDLFSLGSVLYAMITGHAPFRASKAVAVLNRVCNDTPRPIQEIIPETPKWLSDVIAKLHAKKRDARYSNAYEVVEALTNGANDPAKTTLLEKTSAKPPSKKGMVILVGGFLICGLFVLGMILGGVFDSKQKPDGKQPPDLPKEEPKNLSLVELLESSEYQWGPPVNLGPKINTKERDAAPTLTDDELTILFSRKGGLYIGKRKSIDEPFTDVEPLPKNVFDQPRELTSITGDGKLLAMSVLVAERTAITMFSSRGSQSEAFGNPVRNLDQVNPNGWETAPVLSGDGLTLVFTAPRRLPNSGSALLMYTRKTRNEQFDNELVFQPANSSSFTVADWISNDRLVLISTRLNKDMNNCRFQTRPNTETPFGPLQSFGSSLENVNMGRPWLSPDGKRIYFHTRTLEGEGDLDLWMSTRVRKK